MAKTHEIRIKASEDEYKKIESKARSIGMKIAPFLRYVGLNSRLKIEVSDD